MKTPESTLFERARVAKSEPISWTTLFAGLVVVGFANGISLHAMDALRDNAVGALLRTFDISGIVWIALIICCLFLLRPTTYPATRGDQAAAILSVAFFLMPAPSVELDRLVRLGRLSRGQRSRPVPTVAAGAGFCLH